MTKNRKKVNWEKYDGSYPIWAMTSKGRMIGSAKTLKNAKKKAKEYTQKTGKQCKLFRYYGMMIHA